MDGEEIKSCRVGIIIFLRYWSYKYNMPQRLMRVGMVMRVVAVIVRVAMRVGVGVRRAGRRPVRAGHVQVSTKAQVVVEPPNVHLSKAS